MQEEKATCPPAANNHYFGAPTFIHSNTDRSEPQPTTSSIMQEMRPSGFSYLSIQICFSSFKSPISNPSSRAAQAIADKNCLRATCDLWHTSTNHLSNLQGGLADYGRTQPRIKSLATCKQKMRTALIIAALMILAAVTYAYAAANLVPETGAGEGSGTVSGYTITNVDYTLLGSNPSKLDEVSFAVAPTAGAGAAGEVRITVDGGTTWVTCTGPVGSTWTCAFAGGSEPNVSAINLLQIVAVE